jgi:hypothetical protein
MGILGDSFVNSFYSLCLISMDILLLISHTVHSSFHYGEISTRLEERTFFFIAIGHVKSALAIIARLVGVFTPVKSLSQTPLSSPKSAIPGANDSDVNC